MEIEYHPFTPFTPRNAKVLILGTFPPKPHRWSMKFYYPNKTNDFWRIMGLIFYGDLNRFKLPDGTFDEQSIRTFLEEKGIALHDTGAAVRRLKDNASDKFLEIVEPVNLGALLKTMPECHSIVATGEKAAGVLAMLTSTQPPAIGEWVTAQYPPTETHSAQNSEPNFTQNAEPNSIQNSELYTVHRQLEITRMPSTSRAYPLAPEKKAEAYRQMFARVGIL